MAHLALYRKYRSQTFDDLVGQEHVVRTLKNAITRGQIAHAYLFTGPRGTGKTSTARLLAKALNCTGGPMANPPEGDPVCQEIAAGTCMDVIEMDAASEAGVENVRQAIVEVAEYRPSSCPYRIFIIDEVHDLSTKAFDALLKTIEEPPSHVVFILATTEFNKVPPTIRSRCQRFEFHRGSVTDLVGRLRHVAEQEGVESEPAALSAIARMADGGFRDALTLLEQCLVTSEGPLTLEHVYSQLGLVDEESVDRILASVQRLDVPAIIEGVDVAYRQGRDPRMLLESMLTRLSDLTRAAYGIELGGTSDAAVEAGMHAVAKSLGPDTILTLRSAIAEAHRVVRDVTLPRIWLEAELIRIGRCLQAAPAPATFAANPAPAAVPPAKSAPPAATPRPEAPTAAPAPAADGPLGEAQKTWADVVSEMSALSKAAAARMSQSRVVSLEAERVTVEFERVIDAEWVRDSAKVSAAVYAAWRRLREGDVIFQFVGVGKAPQTTGVPKAAVESVLEGDRLVEATKQVFDLQRESEPARDRTEG